MKKNLSITFLLLSIVCLLVSSAETKRSHAAITLPGTVTGTKTVSGTKAPGEIVTYSIVLTNSGSFTQQDNPGDEFTDTLSAGLTLLDDSATSGAVTDNGTDTVSWNGSIPGNAGSVTITIRATINNVPLTTVISNQGTIRSDADNNGTNEATAVTDDPGLDGASDPTSFTVLSPATVSGNKSRSGGTSPGSTLDYLVILSNSSGSDQQDNPGNEFTDVLPAGLTLVSAAASSGTAAATIATNTVTWNGIVPANDSVTISITATINNGTTDQTISNQGTISYDADGNGTNEASASTNSVNFVVGAATASADLGVTKSSSADTLPADSDVTYTITVVNGGPDTADNVALDDSLSGTLAFVSLSSPAGWSCTTPAVGSSGAVNCTKASLTVASGAQVFSLVGHIPAGTANGTVYSHGATVSTSSTDPTVENNTSTSGVLVGCLTNPVVTTSADSGAGSLRRAIQDACVGGTITFDMTPGHVTSPISLTSGALLISQDLTIQGPGANLLSIQRSTAIGTPTFRIFDISAVVSISGLTIANGNTPDGANGGSNPGVNGGGIYNTGTLTITNGTIIANLAGSGGSNSGSIGGPGGDGGGIYNSGTLTIANSTISGNQAGFGGSGGGSGIGGIGGSGGGIANTGTLTVTNSTISGNHSGNGGNSGSAGTGGKGGDGGGVLSDNPATITNSTISGNEVGTGGMAGDNGAASSGRGGGLYKGSVAVVNLRNSIVAGNTSPTGPDINATVNSQDYNLIGNTSGTTITGTTTHNIINQGANLGALASNGGSTETMLPLPGSPAINAGDPANLPPDTLDLDGDTNTIEQLPVDQRGFARVVGANFDIGAVEANYALSATAGTPQSATVNTAFATALSATLTESGNAQNGILVTFTAPLSGSSGTFPGSSSIAVVSTNGTGDASAPTFTANGTAGSYNVVASIGAGQPTATFALTNNKLNQSINFGGLPGKTIGDPDFVVIATATSGLTVTFGASGNCTVSTATVHLTGAGSCTITASQAGDASYNAATPVPQSFSIAKAATSTSVTSLPNPSNFGQSVTFTATVTSTAGTPTGTAQFKDGGTNLGSPQALNGSGVATFSTSSLTAGLHTITADYSGDANFLVSTGTLSGGQQVGAIIRFSSPTYNTTESSRSATITVQRSGELTSAVTVDYATPDDSSATPTILPCSTPAFVSARCDFTTAVGTLKFAANETTKTFEVLISQDNYVEGFEVVSLALSNVSGNAALGSPSAATLTIADDVVEPAANPIDDSQNFVRQHYHDFLNREPVPVDQPGLDFWTNEIESCGANQGCRDVKRENVSAAFFLSIEFQQTGYYVYRTYKPAFGDINPPTVPVPLRYLEFLRDTQEVQRGVIVGQGSWQAQLDSNKQAYALAFVKRPGFLARYPAITSATTFVDTLNTNAGSVLTPVERTALITELSPNPADDALRASVLMKVAENALLKQQEMNRAFVLMQYFGYLRRNPDAAPESGLNFGGYNFWLTKLNSFNGNFIQAEMVKAFINSNEYRKRSGQ